MTSPQEFRQRAAECSRIAETAGEGMGKAFWARLAERWLLCATLAEEIRPASDQAQTSQ